jgi:hypothetical protein
VFVLEVHEVENLFLAPTTLATLIRQNGRDAVAADVVRDAADARAGSWIFQFAMATRNARSLPEIAVQAKEQAKAYAWDVIAADQLAAIARIVDLSGYGVEDRRKLQDILRIAAEAYGRLRMADDLWKSCEGKQVLNRVADRIGFAGAAALTQAAFAAWTRDGAIIPAELRAFREYVSGL